ncbi:MAG: heparinase II/III-family protein, partial [Planctomycetes bacterium]|nr:heparinase II/III-family protein [Planctomycetota bacterium]
MRYRSTLMWLVIMSSTAGHAAERQLAEFVMRDYLRRDWQHELVFYPVDEPIFGRDDVTLIGPDETPIVFQWVPADQAGSGKSSIAFFADLPSLSESRYVLVKGQPVRRTDLEITVTADSIRLENRTTGIRLGGSAMATAGPIAAIRLSGGRWIGGGSLRSMLAPAGCSVQVLARGPVFADALVSYNFPDSGFWRFRVRVIAGEPVILVDEAFALPEGSSYRLRLGEGWEPSRMLFRDNGNRCQLVDIRSLPGDLAMRLRAWPTWWSDPPEAHWTSFTDGSDDLLMIGCRNPGVWVEPGRTEWDTSIAIRKPGLEADFPLQGFQRQWMLASLPKDESIPRGEMMVAPLPQKYLIRHDDVALDKVKDYQLAWNDTATRHPGLFLTTEELDRVRKQLKVDPERLAALRTRPVFPYQMDDHVSYYLATGDVELGRNIADKLSEILQGAVDGFVVQDRLRNQGSSPHHRTGSVMWSAILADLALSPGVLASEERDRIRGQLAFLGYVLASPTFHSPERGYSANPNMTTTARGMLGLVACCIRNHPQAREWAQLGVAEIQRELDTWCDSNGGWLEAPHYMTVSMDSIVPLAIALRGTGFSDTDWLYHPKLKATLAWLAKISTPPDSRLNGDRHMPAIGNTYLGERTCLPGWAAWIWRDKDPDFSRNMQWIWQAHGSPRTPGIGGAYPGLQGYSPIVLDPSLPAQPPTWASERFPDTGAVFRAHFPGERETYLHYIQGRMHQHYDYDEGSFILWGKGRPLCEDFGYYGRAPAADHSRVDDGFPETLGAEGRIEEFASGTADYLRGLRAGWHRQVLFAKDDDPQGPNYFFIRDQVRSGRAADWRIWIATDQSPEVDANPVRAAGRFDTDLAVFFAARPDGPVRSE